MSFLLLEIIHIITVNIFLPQAQTWLSQVDLGSDPEMPDENWKLPDFLKQNSLIFSIFSPKIARLFTISAKLLS